MVPLPKAAGKRQKTSFALDIGFGGAERIRKLAEKKKRNRMIYGIENEKQYGVMPSRQRSIKLMFGDASKRIKNLPSSTFSLVSMDFFPLTDIRREAEIKSTTRIDVRETSVNKFPTLLKDVRRILKPHGRFVITVPGGAVSSMDTVLFANGFRRISFKDVSASEKNSTASMKAHFEMAKTDRGAQPCRIIAVKTE